MRLFAHVGLSAYNVSQLFVAGVLSCLLCPSLMGADGVRPWNLSLSADAGFNANVIQWSDQLDLPVGVSDDEALYGAVSLSAGYKFRKSEQDELSGSYDYSSTLFDQLSDYNQATHVLGADYRRSFASAGMIAAVRGAYEATQIGGSGFRQRIVVRPAVARRISAWMVAEGTWTFLMDAFDRETGVPEQNRDGDTHVGALAAYIYPPSTALQIQIGWLYTATDTKGSDFDSTGTGWVLGLKHPLPWSMSGGLQYTRTSREASEINSLSGEGGAAVSLETDIDTFDVNIEKAFGAHWSARAGYGMSRSEANVSFYTYDQTVWKAGASYAF